MPTMQEKIVNILSELHPERTTRENLYLRVLNRYLGVKIATFSTEFYNLLKKGVVSKGDEGLYGLGAYRTSQLDWLPDAREPIDKEKIGE